MGLSCNPQSPPPVTNLLQVITPCTFRNLPEQCHQPRTHIKSTGLWGVSIQTTTGGDNSSPCVGLLVLWLPQVTLVALSNSTCSVHSILPVMLFALHLWETGSCTPSCIATHVLLCVYKSDPRLFSLQGYTCDAEHIKWGGEHESNNSKPTPNRVF